MGREDGSVSNTAAGSGGIILNSYAYIGDKRNPATATGSTRNMMPIHASLWRERPPRPSKLYIDCPGARFFGKPSILCVVDDLVLFRVCIGPPFVDSVRCSDYFVYRADPERPSLKLLPNPAEQKVSFVDWQAGILPCGKDDYIIAALKAVKGGGNEKFRLHLFDSSSGCWSSKLVPVESPQRDFPVELPICMSDLRQHDTTTVITLGGEGGTMGWVDLWRGIMVCDLLCQNHTLRGVPLPLPPMKPEHMCSGYQSMGHARVTRGIAYVRGILKFVEVETDMTMLSNPKIDAETGWPNFRVDNWEITAWSNDKMSDSYDDWRKSCTLRASDIAIATQCLETDELLQQHQLHSLFVSDPALGMDADDDDVVYLTTRVKFLHVKSWVLALDMKNRMVRGVADAGPHPLREPCLDIMNCPCSISNFTTAKTPGGT